MQNDLILITVDSKLIKLTTHQYEAENIKPKSYRTDKLLEQELCLVLFLQISVYS